MEKVLFLSNEVYIDFSKREGGVRNCTLEFIDLLKEKYEVVIFPVKTVASLSYRIKVKLGINYYNDFAPESYTQKLTDTISENDIRFVFLNMSNTITFSPLIKKITNGKGKVILCSHGNETGDLLHQVVSAKNQTKWYKRLFSSLTLGQLLKIEAYYRIKDIDMVLSISPVEESIEKWLGAKKTFMVPRTIKNEKLQWNPSLNRVGFMGDLSHTPNQYGIYTLCDELSKYPENNIEFRLVGGPEEAGEKIAAKYSFVKYCGFLPDEQLKEEVKTWSYFLNLVFYYSRGVSTKLAKAFGWGIPVISTIAGNRGYIWNEGKIATAADAVDMAKIIINNTANIEKLKLEHEEIDKIVHTSPTFKNIMDQLYPQLEQL